MKPEFLKSKSMPSISLWLKREINNRDQKVISTQPASLKENEVMTNEFKSYYTVLLITRLLILDPYLKDPRGEATRCENDKCELIMGICDLLIECDQSNDYTGDGACDCGGGGDCTIS